MTDLRINQSTIFQKMDRKILDQYAAKIENFSKKYVRGREFAKNFPTEEILRDFFEMHRIKVLLQRFNDIYPNDRRIQIYKLVANEVKAEINRLLSTRIRIEECAEKFFKNH